jgi:uncharacterized protein (TIGR02145 family)
LFNKLNIYLSAILATIILLLFVGCGGDDPASSNNNIKFMVDIDGNAYRIVTIGTQVWMAANLKVTHYRNGDVIPNVTDNTTWAGLTTGAYCEYNNDVNNVAIYGRLYNLYAANDSRNIAPAGWHVPTAAEWQTLVDYLGGNASAGGKMKEAGIRHWQSPNTSATNENGFSALPGGQRRFDGAYVGIGSFCFFWAYAEIDSTFTWYRLLYYDWAEISLYCNSEQSGFSVRCVKD